MISEIKSGKKIYGLIVNFFNASQGTHSASDPAWPLQLLLMKRAKGHVVSRHMHKRVEKVVKQPQEALVVIRGAVRAVIWDRSGKKIGTYNVSAGQCLFLADGAHEIEFTKNTLVFAFKTGPYVDDKIKSGKS